MPDINLLAVLAAAVSAFVLGGLWYSPALFAKSWMRATGLHEDDLQGGAGRIFGGTFALSLIAAFVFALFLGPAPALPFAVGAGASAGLCWVAASFGISYLFERRSLALWAINGGYHTLQFTLYGLVLGLWH
ncbi:MAG: DUF1761 domain-containing protein [Acidobacteriota bacterium]